MTNPSTDKPKPPTLPAHLIAALAAAMLGIGIAVGGAVGPTPSPSLADPSTLLLQALVRSAAQRAAQASASAATTSLSPVATAAVKRRKHKRKHASSTSSAEPESTGSSGNATEKSAPSKSAPNTGATKEKASTLPSLTHVWLIELAGSDFSEVTAHASAAPYLISSAMPQGTLLTGWSALQASAFANDAASIADSSPQLLDTIAQSPCPEGAAGANCTPNSTGALSAADEFLKTTLPSITSTAAYKENGLVVVTFASIPNATETGLPAGAATATLSSTPPTGALLISPFVTAGAESKATFTPTSPKQSLEHLLRR